MIERSVNGGGILRVILSVSRGNKETKMPLPLFESVEQAPFKGSLFLDTSLLVFASSANSMLLKRVGEAALKTISI